MDGSTEPVGPATDGEDAEANMNPTHRDGADIPTDQAGRSDLSRRTYLATLGAAVAGVAAGTATTGAQTVDVTPSEKRGYVGADPARANALGAGWFYNYMPTQDNLEAFETASFVPMINGDDLGWTSGASDRILESDYEEEYVLGYNEPQHEEGYETVDEILYPHWETFTEKFRDTDIQILSPSIKTGTERGRAYFADFMSAVESDDSLEVDEIAIHWYAGTEAMRDDPETQAQWFLDRLESIHQTYGLPIWLTEFGGPNFANVDAEALAQSNIVFLEHTIPELEARDYVSGYAWWEGGRATRLTEEVDGTVQLTDVGEAYVGLSDGSGSSRVGDLPSTETVPAGTYRVESVNSGHVLEVADGSQENGANVRQGVVVDEPHQRWRFRYEGEGRYVLEAAHSGSVADVHDASGDEGATVQQWEANDGDHQRWYVDPLGEEQYRIVAAHSRLVLDVADASTEDGANVLQWGWNGDDNQRWEVVPVEEEPPSEGIDVGGYTARDLTGDDLYRDVDGTGTTGSNDVVAFFERFEESAVQENAEHFDFNGSGGVGFDDVVALFEQI